LVTLFVDTGPDGDLDPYRSIAKIVVNDTATLPSYTFNQPSVNLPKNITLLTTVPTLQRNLYFSEEIVNDTVTRFFYNSRRSNTTTQGSVEDWYIENRAKENHIFHIHQIHFILLKRNNTVVSFEEMQYIDIVDIPYWSGQGSYPSVLLRMDFTGAFVGDAVYHCHILEHEDNGMMAKIRVLPNSASITINCFNLLTLLIVKCIIILLL